MRRVARDAPVDDYLYDVFVSYKHDPRGLITPWISEVAKRLEYRLANSLPRECRVFFDKEMVEVGDHWPDKLRHAILASRCLVPILSPEYFRSRWCLIEWGSFLARQRQLQPPCGSLIVPVKAHDGEWFPQEARDIEPLDLTEHASTVESYWQTVKANELDQLLRLFAERVARVVMEAPPFSAEWTIHEPDPPPPPRGFGLSRL